MKNETRGQCFSLRFILKTPQQALQSDSALKASAASSEIMTWIVQVRVRGQGSSQEHRAARTRPRSLHLQLFVI